LLGTFANRLVSTASVSVRELTLDAPLANARGTDSARRRRTRLEGYSLVRPGSHY